MALKRRNFSISDENIVQLAEIDMVTGISGAQTVRDGITRRHRELRPQIETWKKLTRKKKK